MNIFTCYFLAGIVTKPVEGARTGGFGGLMKGVGKGLVGAVTRPVSGVVDFASSSFDAVKTVAGGSDAAKALRPPRLISRKILLLLEIFLIFIFLQEIK